MGKQGSIYIHRYTVTTRLIVQEVCESRGGRPGLSVLTSGSTLVTTCP